MLRSDLIPTPEDWLEIQGGRPQILESPNGGRFDVVHVYSTGYEDRLASQFPHFGCVIPTAGKNLMPSLANPIEIEFINNHLETPTRRIVRVPSSLLIKFHGMPCSDRTYTAGSRRGEYDKIRSVAITKSF